MPFAPFTVYAPVRGRGSALRTVLGAGRLFNHGERKAVAYLIGDNQFLPAPCPQPCAWSKAHVV